MPKVLVDLIDNIGVRYTRYAVIDDGAGQETDFPNLQDAGTFRRVYTVKAAPLLLTRQWQLVDRDNFGEVWEIERINRHTGYGGSKNVHCVRHADRYDPTYPSPLDSVVLLWGDEVLPVFDNVGVEWGDF